MTELKIVYIKNWENEEFVDIGSTCMECGRGPCSDTCIDIDNALKNEERKRVLENTKKEDLRNLRMSIFEELQKENKDVNNMISLLEVSRIHLKGFESLLE